MNRHRQSYGQLAEEAMQVMTGHHSPKIAHDATATGKKRLEAAASGLPVNLLELTDFFREDLEDFGNGAVSMAGIRKACEWFAYAHKGRLAPC